MKTRLIPLALACLLAVAPAKAQVNYAVSGGTAYVWNSPNASGDIVIASTYNGFPVTSIGIQAFSGCTGLTSVTIPDSVTSLQSQAFALCTSLTNVTIPDSVISLGDRAFQNCYRLAGVVIGSRVTGIGQLAFNNCSSLTSVTIPDSVTILDHLAFNGCTGLTNVILGRSVAIIGQWAFGSCTGLTSVTLPDSVTTIWRQAFSGCTSLASVTIGNGLSSIEPQAFQYCTSLANLSVDAANPVYSSLDGVLFNKAQTTLLVFPPGRGGSYVIPNSVTNTGVSAFASCTSLMNVTIPNSVTGIGSASFGGCTGLTRVTIPSSVSRIGHEAFMSCTKVTNFTFLGNAPALVPYPTNSLAGRWFFNVGAGAKAYYYCGTTGWGATYGSLSTEMLCPPQVNYAVSGNTAYVTGSPNASGDIVIASTYLGFPVTSIAALGFYNCTSLTSVTIPNSVAGIGSSAFGLCTNLTNLSVDAANPVYSSLDGALFDKTQTTLLMCPVGRAGSFVIPDSVTSIGINLNSTAGAFSDCTRLTNVIMGHSVTNIGFAAFFGCTNLTRVTIPASVTGIYAMAFYNCRSLTNLTFLGNPPQLIPDMEAGMAQFQNIGAGAKVYYYCGTTGWGATYGLPTVMLCPPQFAPASAGVKPGGFGFTLTSLTNQTIVVEASIDLVNWHPIWTNSLPGASVNFVDPEWLQHPARFYRARPD